MSYVDTVAKVIADCRDDVDALWAFQVALEGTVRGFSEAVTAAVTDSLYARLQGKLSEGHTETIRFLTERQDDAVEALTMITAAVDQAIVKGCEDWLSES